MGKFGVGVGDDFPIDDGNKPETGAADAGADHAKDREEYERRREEWRKQRDEWRARRNQWRDEWRRRKREFRAEMHKRYGDDYDGHDHHWHYSGDHVVKLLGLLGLVAVTIMIFSHIYILMGLIVLAGLYFAYRRGGLDHFDFPRHGHPPGPNPPAPPSDAPKS
jgi:hypothetical protein